MNKYPIHSENMYIPYEMMLEHEEQCLINHHQSVETLARRGGTDYLETYFILNNKKYDTRNFKNLEQAEQKAKVIVLSKAYIWLMQNHMLGE